MPQSHHYNDLHNFEIKSSNLLNQVQRSHRNRPSPIPNDLQMEKHIRH